MKCGKEEMYTDLQIVKNWEEMHPLTRKLHSWAGTKEASETWRGTILRGHFLRMKRALLCLLQNLGGHVPPGSYVYVPGYSSL